MPPSPSLTALFRENPMATDGAVDETLVVLDVTPTTIDPLAAAKPKRPKKELITEQRKVETEKKGMRRKWTKSKAEETQDAVVAVIRLVSIIFDVPCLIIYQSHMFI